MIDRQALSVLNWSIPLRVKYKVLDKNRAVPCPFCGGMPDLMAVVGMSIEGDEYLLRCSKCHASTKESREKREEAFEDWNNGEIVDDHLFATMDQKIDRYLRRGVLGIWATGYGKTYYFPKVQDGFLYGTALILTKDSAFFLDNENKELNYDVDPFYRDPCRRTISIENGEPRLYGMDWTNEWLYKSIAKAGEKIRFVRSRWKDSKLLSVEFRCGRRHVTLSASLSGKSMMVQYR